MDKTLRGGSVMVITHFVLVWRGVPGVTVDGASVVVVIVTCNSLFDTVALGSARLVWISALRARAVLRFSLICSIRSWSSCSSPGSGGAKTAVGRVTAAGGRPALLNWVEEEDAEGRVSPMLAKEAVGPPFSHALLFGTLGLAGPFAPPTLVSQVAM